MFDEGTNVQWPTIISNSKLKSNHPTKTASPFLISPFLSPVPLFFKTSPTPKSFFLILSSVTIQPAIHQVLSIRSPRSPVWPCSPTNSFVIPCFELHDSFPWFSLCVSEHPVYTSVMALTILLWNFWCTYLSLLLSSKLPRAGTVPDFLCPQLLPHMTWTVEVFSKQNECSWIVC